MAINVTDQRIRLALDISQWGDTPTDVITNASPAIANAADLQFELAFSYGPYLSDAQVVNVANFASVTVSLKNSGDIDGLSAWSVTIPATQLNAALTFANWEAGTDQACIVQIPSSVNDLFLPTGSSTFQCVISAWTTAPILATTTATFASGTQTITVASGSGIAFGQLVTGSGIPANTTVTSVGGTTVTISQQTTGASSGNYTFLFPARLVPVASFPVTVDDIGLGSDTPTGFQANQYYTSAQSDARYVQIGTSYANFAQLSGATFTGAVVLESAQMTGATGLYATTKAYTDAGDAATAAAAVPNTGTSTIAGAKTFSSLLTAASGLTVAGTTTLATSLGGVLLATAGVVSGSASTSNLTEGSNLYFTNARAIASTLTGFAVASGTITSSDSVLTAFEKVGYYMANSTYGGATVWPVSSQAAMLALSTANKGDWAFRSDILAVFVLGSGTYSLLASWTQWYYPVISVNGSTGTGGAVVLTSDNVAEGSTNLYFTSARADARIALQRSAANGLAPLDTNAFVPWVNLPTLTGYSSTTGTITAADTILSAIEKLNGNQAAAVSPITAVLTGYSSTTGTISSSDTILSAIEKLAGNAAAQAACLPLTAGSGSPLTGALFIADSTASTLALQIGNAWGIRTSASDANLDLRCSGTTVLTVVNDNTVHAPAGWFDTPNGYKIGGNQFVMASSSRNYLDFGGNFTVTTSGSFAGLVLQYSGSPGLTLDTSNNVTVANVLNVSGASNFTGLVTGTNSFNTSNQYQLATVGFAYLSSSRVMIDFGGSFTMTTQSAFAAWQIGYSGTAAISVDQNNYTHFGAAQILMGNNKVIDNSNYFYDSSGNQLLSGRQSPSFSGGSSGATGWTDSTAQSDFNNLIAALKTHGLIHY